MTEKGEEINPNLLLLDVDFEGAYHPTCPRFPYISIKFPYPMGTLAAYLRISYLTVPSAIQAGSWSSEQSERGTTGTVTKQHNAIVSSIVPTSRDTSILVSRLLSLFLSIYSFTFERAQNYVVRSPIRRDAALAHSKDTRRQRTSLTNDIV